MTTVRVGIMLKPGVLDAQGQAVEGGLQALGFNVENVRVGRTIELSLCGDDVDEQVRNMCERFLINPLIEHYWVDHVEPGGGAA